MRKVKVWAWQWSMEPSCVQWPASLLTWKLVGESSIFHGVPLLILCVSQWDSLEVSGHLTLRITGGSRHLLLKEMLQFPADFWDLAGSF